MIEAVLPHGGIEIPALVISTAYGLWLGVEYARRVGQRDWEGAGSQVRHAVTMYFKVAFPTNSRYQGAEKLLVTGAVSPVTMFSRVA